MAEFVQRHKQIWRVEKIAYQTSVEAFEESALLSPLGTNVYPGDLVRVLSS